MVLENRMNWTVHWEKILGIIAGLIVIQSFLKGFFGINLIGKKLYKGAPLIWRWIITIFTYRKDVSNNLKTLIGEVREIKKEVKDNGGSSLKDAVKRIEANQGIVLQRFEAAEMLSDKLTFRMDDHGAMVHVSDAFRKYFGYSDQDLLGFNWENVIHEDDIIEARTKWTRAIDKIGRFYQEQRIKADNGEMFNCIVKAIPITENGVLKEFSGSVEIIND